MVELHFFKKDVDGAFISPFRHFQANVNFHLAQLLFHFDRLPSPNSKFFF